MKSCCGKCGGSTFEIKEVEPKGAKFKHYFVQCQKCGVPAGIVEYRNSSALVEELSKEVKAGQAALYAELRKIADRLAKLEK